MANTQKKPRSLHLRVPVLPEEAEAIKAQARQARRPVARYLREVGMGYRLHSSVDQEAVLQLAKINGDLGRLGGVLKLWIARDARTRSFTPATVAVLLQRIEARQAELGRVMQEVVRPRGGA